LISTARALVVVAAVAVAVVADADVDEVVAVAVEAEVAADGTPMSTRATIQMMWRMPVAWLRRMRVARLSAVMTRRTWALSTTTMMTMTRLARILCARSRKRGDEGVAPCLPLALRLGARGAVAAALRVALGAAGEAVDEDADAEREDQVHHTMTKLTMKTMESPTMTIKLVSTLTLMQIASPILGRSAIWFQTAMTMTMMTTAMMTTTAFPPRWPKPLGRA
jgi:hypothetical protein